MTAAVTEVTRTAIEGSTYDVISTTLGVIAILLLIILLTEKELMRAFDGPRSRVGVRILNIAIVPLLLTFAFIMIMRFADLLR